MGTAETLIVFSALMALIAVVTIGIDWIGKPLKNRRFIPRIYRFDDEKLPVDAYGNTRLHDEPADLAPMGPGSGPYGPPVQLRPPPRPASYVAPVNATVPVPVVRPAIAAAMQAAPSSVAAKTVVPAVSASAFSDSLAVEPAPHATIAGTTSADRKTSAEAAPSAAWQPGMALDTSVDGRKPSLAAKAERFWIATASSMETSHFGDDNIARMAAGKAPRRANPRTGRAEAMQLTGLRQASAHTQVRMRWPDDAVDPWVSA